MAFKITVQSTTESCLNISDTEWYSIVINGIPLVLFCKEKYETLVKGLVLGLGVYFWRNERQYTKDYVLPVAYVKDGLEALEFPYHKSLFI